MIYSVYNYGSRTFDYYEADVANAAHAGKPPRSSLLSESATPEQAAWPLPMGAKLVGSGTMPKGRIAGNRGPLAGLGLVAGDSTGMVTIGIAAVVGLIWWSHRRK